MSLQRQCSNRLIRRSPIKAPLSNGIWSLRDLKRTGARRASPVKLPLPAHAPHLHPCRRLPSPLSSATTTWRCTTGPAGRGLTPSALSALHCLDRSTHALTARDGGNAGFAGAKTCQQCALIAESAVGQSSHIINQRIHESEGHYFTAVE